ncbi:hypothetical protein [Vibrio phage V-YDF132]|nr:hypothetical protein [Vibrio phage V-YDF132]
MSQDALWQMFFDCLQVLGWMCAFTYGLWVIPAFERKAHIREARWLGLPMTWHWSVKCCFAMGVAIFLQLIALVGVIYLLLRSEGIL